MRTNYLIRGMWLFLTILVVSSVPSVAQIDFEGRRDYMTVSDSPGDGLIGDFDGDGIKDIVTLEGCAPVPSLGFFRGLGGGLFAPPVAHPSMDDLETGVNVDVNLDGRQDVLGVAGSRNDVLYVFLGSGDAGLFDTPLEISVLAGSAVEQVVDVNEDGFLDIVGRAGPDRIAVYAGDGTGSFVFLSEIPTCMNPRDFDLGYLDGDAHLDLAYVAGFCSEVHVLVGRGDGIFDALALLPLLTDGEELLIEDLNGDGSQDVGALTCGGPLSLFANDGTGLFQEMDTIDIGVDSARDLEMEDLNEDGFLDILMLGSERGSSSFVSTLGWALSDGLGGYLPPRTEHTIDFARTLRFDDLDGDDHVDVVVSGTQGVAVSVHFGDGQGGLGSFAPTIATGFSVDDGSNAVDWTGDGLPDVMVTGDTGPFTTELRLFSGQSDGTVALHSIVRTVTGEQLRHPLGADFDRDGCMDVVVAAEPWSILLGDGQGGFSQGFFVQTGARGDYVETGDFNEDGWLDVVVSITTQSRINVYLSNGTGGFQLPASMLTGLFLVHIEVGDVDGDGHLDLGLCGGATPRILFGDGQGGFPTSATIPHGVSAPRVLVLRDFDADGLLDVGILGQDDIGALSFGRVSIVRNTTGRAFQVVETHDIPKAQNLLESLDADGDGIDDLVAANGISTCLAALRGRGDGTFEDLPYCFGAGELATGRRMAIADFDQDGMQDVLFPTALSRDLSLLYNRSPAHPDRVGNALQGVVNAGRGSLSDVLFVNGAAGDPAARSLSVGIGSPFEITMVQPPTRARTAAQSRFALFAWRRVPSADRLVELPFEAGTLVFPIPATGGGPQPKRTWNNLGSESLLGSPDLPSQPADSTVITLAGGVGFPVIFTLQGLIQDDGAPEVFPVSPTNGIVVTIE